MAQDGSFVIPELSVRHVVLATLVVVAVGLGFALLFRLHRLFLLLFAAIVISTAIRPAVDWLHRRGLPRLLGVALLYLLLLAFVVGLLLLGAPLIAEQSTNLANAIPEAYSDLRQSMLRNPNLFVWRLGVELPPQLPLTASGEASAEESVSAVAQAWQTIGLVASAIFAIFAILALAFYWTLEGERTKRALLLLLPLDKRESARELVTTIENNIGNYIIGQATLALIIGVLALTAYLLIGLPYALVLAILAGIMEVVPLIGPTLGAIPAVIVAFSVDPVKVMWVIVATAVIQQLENSFLVPRVMDRAVGVNPLVTLLALTAFGSLFGIVGALVAIPVAAVVQILLQRFVLDANGSGQSAPEGRDQLSLLRHETQELVQDVRKQVRRKEESADTTSDEIEDSLEAIANDLEAILAQIHTTRVRS
jgi:predicted PurR-regulated permease PerM